MPRRLFRNYRIISVMFWSFPYLLWQAFGHWSGFFVGVIVAVILSTMFNNLFRANNWSTASSARQQSFQMTERQPGYQETESYQHGYRAKAGSYRAEPHLDQTGELQSQYEGMQVLYPEMPPME